MEKSKTTLDAGAPWPFPVSRTYIGVRSPAGCEVLADGLDLSPRFDLANHSPTGFEWRYLGSGPAQLALALCADALGDDVRALRVYQEFKANVVANLAEAYWKMTASEVREEVFEIEKHRRDS